MTTAKLSSTFLILLLLCLNYGHCGVKKIKIHVPYYVKHVHHYKKVYVPKVHVIKHEHHHKKEYDHHHHHHEVYKHSPFRSYEKSSHEFPDEFSHHDVFYDDIESKSFRTHGRKRFRPAYRTSSSEKYKGWKDVDGSDYGEDSGEEEDYAPYRKSNYFIRRSDTSKEDDDEEEDENEGGEIDEGGEEDDSDDVSDRTTPIPLRAENIVSITTPENILQ